MRAGERRHPITKTPEALADDWSASVTGAQASRLHFAVSNRCNRGPLRQSMGGNESTCKRPARPGS